LEETSSYYLLAWRPNKKRKETLEFHDVKVLLMGRRDLTVRLPRGFLRDKPEPSASIVAKPREVKTVPQELGQALSAVYPKRDIQTSLYLTYLDTPEHGLVLTASVQVADAGLSFDAANDKQVAAVDLAGVVLNDAGKAASSFHTRLN